MGNALASKLAAAQSAISAGNPQLAVNILGALLYELRAQSGKHISTACTIGGITFNAAAALSSDVQSMISALKVLPNPIVGYLVNSKGAGVSGATASITNGAGAVLGTATADATGFYAFTNTSAFTAGSSYTVKISFSAPYKSSNPASQKITWQGREIGLGNFILN